MSAQAVRPGGAGDAWMRLPALLVGLALMLLITAWPPLLTAPDGRADHVLALLFGAAMAAGFVRGVGFVPHWWLWRGLFSGWSCLAFLLAGLGWKLL